MMSTMAYASNTGRATAMKPAPEYGLHANPGTTASGSSPGRTSALSSAQEYGLHQDLTFDGYAWRRAKGIAVAASVHAQISRNSFLWAKIEPSPGVFDWSIPDSVVNDLGAKGIEPLFVLYGSPSWANGVPASTPDGVLYVPPEGPAFDRWLSNYVTFVRKAVTRYKGRVAKWEVWNEENERFFWKPAPSVDQYARFFTTIRTAILAADPQAQVAVGGLAGLSCSIDIPGVDFLKGLVARNVSFDYVAIHPYSSLGQAPNVHIQWQDNFDDIGLIHDYLVSVGMSVPLWVTEWGWSTAQVDPAVQAQYIATSLELLRTRYRYVTVATYFLDKDHDTAYQQGLFDASYDPKPAAAAFLAFMDQLTRVPLAASSRRAK